MQPTPPDPQVQRFCWLVDRGLAGPLDPLEELEARQLGAAMTPQQGAAAMELLDQWGARRFRRQVLVTVAVLVVLSGALAAAILWCWA